MLKYMLDTNIVIYAIKNRPQQIRECFKKHQGQMCLSTVTLGELIFGAERSQQVKRNLADIEAMVARMEVLPLDNEAAVSAGISELKKNLWLSFNRATVPRLSFSITTNPHFMQFLLRHTNC